MFGMKTLVVGGGAVALLWMMNNHASAGDLVNSAPNGVSAVSNGYQSLQSGYQNVSTGVSTVQSALNNVGSGMTGLAGGTAVTAGTRTGAGTGVSTGVSTGVGASGTGASTSGSGLSGPAVELNPSAARPGQQVLITVPTCIQPDSGTATSVVFANNGSVSLTRNPKGAGLAGTATIISTAQNGSWSVNVTCGTGPNSLNGVTNITIFGGASPAPTNPPKAGGGGSVMKGDVGMTAGGIALVAGGVGYGLWSMRRRGADGTHAG